MGGNPISRGGLINDGLAPIAAIPARHDLTAGFAPKAAIRCSGKTSPLLVGSRYAANCEGLRRLAGGSKLRTVKGYKELSCQTRIRHIRRCIAGPVKSDFMERVTMRKTLRAAGFTAMCAILAAAPMAAFAYSGQELASGAQVSIDQARTIALKTISGEIIDEELETEEGGSGLRYTFNIKRGSVTYEIGVDARSGAVIENSTDGNAH